MASHYRELMVYGWLRGNGIQMPMELVTILGLFACSFVKWKIKAADCESYSKSLEGPTINADGINLNISLMHQRYETKIQRYRSKFSRAAYLNLTVDKTSLIPTILNMTAMVKMECDIFKDKQRPHRLFFDFQDFGYEQNILLDCDLSGNKHKEIDMELVIEIIDIKYHKMRIISCLKWELHEDELQKFNSMERAIDYKDDNWMIILYDNGKGDKGMHIKPVSLPPDVTDLKCEYKVVIEVNSKEEGDDRLEVKGFRKFNKDRKLKPDFDLCLMDVYTKCSILIQMEIFEIYTIEHFNNGLDQSMWNEYGFFGFARYYRPFQSVD